MTEKKVRKGIVQYTVLRVFNHFTKELLSLDETATEHAKYSYAAKCFNVSQSIPNHFAKSSPSKKQHYSGNPYKRNSLDWLETT